MSWFSDAAAFARRLLVLALAVGSAGCYTYEPAEAPSPGTEVRARLRTEAALRRSDEVGEPTRHVDGTLVALTAESVAVDVLLARDPSVFRNITLRDTLSFRRDEVEEVLARRLAPVRTALAIGVGAAGVAALVHQVVDGLAGGEGDDNVGPPPDRGALVPDGVSQATSPRSVLLRLRWPPR